MPFIQKRVSVGTERFGDELRELRELRGYDRETLGRISGIHASIITALEEERLETMTDPIYAERHVRTIVRALEGRPEFFLKKYRALTAEQGLAAATTPIIRPGLRRRDLFVSSKAMVVGFFVLIVLVVGGYVGQQAYHVSRPPSLTLDTPVEGAVLSDARVLVSGTTDPSASVTVNGFTAIVDADGTFRSEIDVPTGFSVLHIEARRRYSRPTVVERHVMYRHEVTIPGSGTSTESIDQ